MLTKNFSLINEMNHKFVLTKEKLVHDNDLIFYHQLNVMYYSMIVDHQQFVVVVVQEISSLLIENIEYMNNFHYIYVQEMNLNMYQVDVSLLNLSIMLIH